MEQASWKRYCDDCKKQSRHYVGKKQLRQFALTSKTPLTRLEVLLLYKLIENQNALKGELKRLAEVVNSPYTAFDQQLPAKEKSISLSNKSITLDCSETITKVQQFIGAKNISLSEWLHAFNADKSGMIKLDELNRVFTKLSIPVSKLEQRQLCALLSQNGEIPVSDIVRTFQNSSTGERAIMSTSLTTIDKPADRSLTATSSLERQLTAAHIMRGSSESPTADSNSLNLPNIENDNALGNSIIKLEQQYNNMSQQNQSSPPQKDSY